MSSPSNEIDTAAIRHAQQPAGPDVARIRADMKRNQYAEPEDTEALIAALDARDAEIRELRDLLTFQAHAHAHQLDERMALARKFEQQRDDARARLDEIRALCDEAEDPHVQVRVLPLGLVSIRNVRAILDRLPTSSGQTAEHGIDTAAIRARGDAWLDADGRATMYDLCDALDRQREEAARLRENLAGKHEALRQACLAFDRMERQRDDARGLAAALEAQLAEIETTVREIRTEAQEFEPLTDAADAAMSARVLVCNKVLAILDPAGAGDGEAQR